MERIRDILFGTEAAQSAAKSILPAAVPYDSGRRFHLWACAVVAKRQELHGDLDRDWLHVQ